MGIHIASVVADKTPSAPPLSVFDAQVEKLRSSDVHNRSGPLRLSASPPPSLPHLLPKLTVTTSKQGSEEGAENQRVLLASLPFVYPRILLRAEAEMPLCPARFPILGEYKECFSGEEFAASEKVAGRLFCDYLHLSGG